MLAMWLLVRSRSGLAFRAIREDQLATLEAWRLVMYGALLILVMLFAPKGLAGLKKYVW